MCMSTNNQERDQYGNGVANTNTILGQKIVKLRKNDNGSIERFMLEDGTELSYAEALQKIEAGVIDNLIVQRGRDGQPIIRSKPDGNPNNNLDNLPEF